ncbi:MAG: thiamine diphosphokinase [Anaerolineales bacterium]|nr:thiamine diphosphokinase [Anaerolineales bacterium]
MPTNRAVIFANGILPNVPAAQRLLREGDFWIAADGGCRHALACGRAPDVLVGDLDSIPNGIRQTLDRAGTVVKSFPAEKNETDLELAIRFAVREGFAAVLILGGLGGRTDQTLANLALLFDAELAGINIRIDDGREEAVRVWKRTMLRGAPGDTVSLLAWGVPAEGVTTEGLKYPLSGERLLPHKTRGISNCMLADEAAVTVQKGALLCIHTRSNIKPASM